MGAVLLDERTGLGKLQNSASGTRKADYRHERFHVARVVYSASHQYLLCLLYAESLHRPLEEVGADLLEACCVTNENEGTGRKPCAAAMPWPSQACDLVLWKEYH